MLDQRVNAIGMKASDLLAGTVLRPIDKIGRAARGVRERRRPVTIGFSPSDEESA
ncbi:hypothetical protein [Halomonas halophila]|uniref:UmuC domain-containing protein n=1 Tax=Halomonas halophila TaxID=29573 RepID=A0ABQ0U048_9GAMM|nr:hypothetical protein HHA04nite_04620 [Halomonas halophila]